MPRVHHDERTRIAVVRSSFSPLSTERGAAFTLEVFKELERQRAVRADQPAVGVVAAWRDEEGARQHAVRVVFHEHDTVDPIAISIGRHSHCDVPLVPGASLRHALLLLWPSGRGEVPRMDAIDLATGVGLGVGEAKPATRIEGMGPVRFGVGGAEVLVLPAAAGASLAPGGAAALLAELADGSSPVRSFLAEADKAALPIVDRSTLVWAKRREQSSVADGLAALERTPTSVFQLRGPRPPPRLNDRVHVLVSAPEVVDGLLLGRYDRCRGSAELACNNRVSRVHAYVFARRGRTYVVDAGSKNGTEVVEANCSVRVSLNAAARVARLKDDDRLMIGGTEVVVLVEGRTPNMPSGGVA
jgi:hypothetical protein